tara:strand:+ start:36913 stop:39111 length:2199 start_codon:yes stop_codon:yes gene_type:complete
MNFLVAEVLVPIPVHKTFSYLIPCDLRKLNIKTGCRVLVPFRNRKIVGVIYSISKKELNPNHNLKGVLEILDSDPLLCSNSLKLCKWASEYYHYPLGEVMSLFFPPLLRKGKAAKFKEVSLWQITDVGEFAPLEDLSKYKKQLSALKYFQINKSLTSSESKAHGFSSSSLKSLEKKGFLENLKKEISPFKAFMEPSLKRFTLNKEQQDSVDVISQSINNHKIFLLNGVTGSGKTEVYLRLIEEVVKQGKQALILIPEIGLAPQAEYRFKAHFGSRVSSFHSAKNEREKLDVWLGAKFGHLDIVIGTRSSIFVPMKNLGIIVIDEEHDLSFKQMDGFRYSARDMALYRSKLENIPAILASASPSLESIKNSKENKYKILQLTKRATGASLPTFQSIDIRKKTLKEGFSEELLAAIGHELTEKNQVLIFINRRGFSPSLICEMCGWASSCNRCDANMTYHKQNNFLQCHHCSSILRYPDSCPSCNSKSFHNFGYGTERIEDFLNIEFPEYPVLRIDSDSTKRKDSFDTFIQQINQGKPLIMVGTQLLAKGHNFPNVTLVGIIDADSGLFSADFRGSERVAQLMTQVSGRAGRFEKPGRVLLQTFCPDHPQIEQIVSGNYQEFALNLLEERRKNMSPPYSYQAKLQAESLNSSISRDFIKEILDENKKTSGLKIIGPLPSLMEKKSGFYRWELNIFSTNRKRLHNFLSSLYPSLTSSNLSKKVRWLIDVDPISPI